MDCHRQSTLRVRLCESQFQRDTTEADNAAAEGTGAGDWAAAYTQARAFVAQLTNEEKWNLTAGMSGNNSCSGNIIPIPRLGFPGLCLSDAGNGLVSCSPILHGIYEAHTRVSMSTGLLMAGANR